MHEFPVVLYDGVCNLCSSSVAFILRRDISGRFRFAALQSDFGKSQLRFCGAEHPIEETIIFVEKGKCYTRSDAILRILSLLSGGWRLLGGLRIIPKPLRDWFYGIISRNRYKWFGKQNKCMMSSVGFEDRFFKGKQHGSKNQN
jgi:predicted DCC family thiol-disulfide oxidoreductase YuxK